MEGPRQEPSQQDCVEQVGKGSSKLNGRIQHGFELLTFLLTADT
jgi:hypothetical protein